MQPNLPAFQSPSLVTPTHLDAQETAVQPNDAPPSPEAARDADGPVDHFRHSGWKADRQRIYDAMVRTCVSPGRIGSFCRCGTEAWILRNRDDPELFRVVPDHCHDRFCVPCGGQRQAVIRRNLDTKLTDKPHRFLTLTIRSETEPLVVLIRRLYAGFRRLRNRRMWKDRVTGGVAFLEVTYNTARTSWHPHLHAVLEGKYIDLQVLIREWLSCTGDSRSVKIKLIRSKYGTINYITKYATKPLPSAVVGWPAALDEALQVLRSRRTILCFGSWRRWRLLDNPADEGWQLYAHLNTVTLQAELDDPLALNILAMLSTADPASGNFYVHCEAPEPDD